MTALWRDCPMEGLPYGGTALWRDCPMEGLPYGGTALWRDCPMEGDRIINTQLQIPTAVPQTCVIGDEMTA